MKTVLITSILICTAIALSVALVFRFTSGLTETVDNLFSSVEANDTAQMEALLSDGFLANTAPEQLLVWLTARGLNDVKETSWSHREISGGVGTLSGTAITREAGSIPIDVVLVKEGGSWKIHSIEAVQPGISGISLPSEEEQITLFHESTGRFLTSIEAGDMGYFREGISDAWKSQNSTEDLNQAYQAFFRLAELLKGAKESEPALQSVSGPDHNGVIQITGYYPLEEVRLHIEQNFIQENGSWKLHGFHTQTEAREP